MSDHWHAMLSGIVGSTAYGLATEESDVDRLGFAAAPTEAFHGLHMPTGKAATREQHEPDDRVVHEVGKYVALVLAANPTVSELLFLPDELYEVRTDLADELIGMRSRLLSAERVKNAYLGYATAQFRKLRDRGRYPNVPENRVRKHSRHMLRLIHQGRDLYLTGQLEVRLAAPWIYHEFADRIVNDPERGIEAAQNTLGTTLMALESKPSALPLHPDERAADDWLRRVRRAYYTASEVAA